MKVIVDPSCNILYSSYYLYGLKQYFGKQMSFAAHPFKSLPFSFEHLALVIQDEHQVYKIIIDFNNRKAISQEHLTWCDVYGKVNLAPEDQVIPKVVPIGPLTAIQLYDYPTTVWKAAMNYLKSWKKIKGIKTIKTFLIYYKYQLSRPRFEKYQPKQPKKNYAFFAASLWKKEAEANQLRANFIKACQQTQELEFEGGFAPRTKRDIKGFEQLTMPQKVTYDEFYQKTEASTFVFNTPTVQGCNGWRLAEYLAMGKAIISTPLVRLVPKELIDEKHVLFVSGSQDSIQQAIQKLLNDQELRHNLSKNTISYFQEYLAPQKVIEQLIDRVKQIGN
ncbi:MAG: glycosyltransferase [Flammeovirgaceae bacterium]